jgi:signal transduction histidine kinase
VGFDHTQEIRSSQVRLLFEQLPSALFATVVNATILIAVLQREFPGPLLWSWFLATLAVAALRYGQMRRYFRASPDSVQWPVWRRWHFYGVAANGLLWGFAGFFFFTAHNYTDQVFLAFVLVGMAAGGIATLSSVRGAYLVFLMPALLPYAVRLVTAGAGLHLAMAGMLVVYVLMMGIISDRLYATVAESLGLRFANVDLLHDLMDAKERQETAQNALQKSHTELERRVEERTEDLAKSEESLRNADRRKDEFLAMLAHELRNPLAPIRNAMQIMRKPGVSDDVAAWAAQVIDRQVDHLTRLVDDLLDVSRIVHGKISLKDEILEIASIINEAVEGSRPLLDARRQELSVRIPEETVRVKGDHVRLAQIVSNLLNNAAKYSETGQRIWLDVETSERWVAIRVRDNGIGISSDLLPYVFDLFAQANHNLARTQGGLGLGLTLVKRLVEMHGGRVQVWSKGLGHGSEFFVQLPRVIVPEPTEVRVPYTEEGGREAPIRVLVVDDNSDALESMAMLMRFEGHTVAVASDGASALAEAAQFHPQVVLLDIGMPGMDGYDVARELRARHSERMVIIALTGYGQPEDRERTKAAGFTDHVTKPIDPGALNEIMKAHLIGSSQ